MKTKPIVADPLGESWDGNKGRMKQLFAWVTGYDIMFEASRKDLPSGTMPVAREDSPERANQSAFSGRKLFNL